MALEPGVIPSRPRTTTLLTYSSDEWEIEKRASLGRNVLREGILLFETVGNFSSLKPIRS